MCLASASSKPWFYLRGLSLPAQQYGTIWFYTMFAKGWRGIVRGWICALGGVGISGEHPATCPCTASSACSRLVIIVVLPVPVSARNQRQGIRLFQCIIPKYWGLSVLAGTHNCTHCLTRNQKQGIRPQDHTSTVYFQAPLYTVYKCWQLRDAKTRHPLIIAPSHCCIQCWLPLWLVWQVW